MPTEQGERPRPLAGRYDLGERLGHGGMAEVRTATDRRLGREVAVKLLRVDLAEQPVTRRRFETEAQSAAGLTHPNIVTVYDCGEDNGRPFLVMERLPGRTFADDIALGPLPLARAIDVSCAVLSALTAAHDAGIIHRDIKPGNVLLTDTGVPKVSDFGIAKTAEASTATLTGELLATPAYLAPERIRGEPASRESDLYAVGVLLYESLSGTRPFQGDTPMAMLDAVAHGNAIPLSRVRPGLPDSVLAAVDRAMATDPASRFHSAAEMASALEAQPVMDETVRLETDDPATTLPFAAPARDGHTSALPPRTALPQPPRLARPARPARSRTARRWVAIGIAVLLVAAVAIGIVATRDDGGEPSVTSPRTTPTVAVSQVPSAGAPLPAPLDRSLRDLEQAVSR